MSTDADARIIGIASVWPWLDAAETAASAAVDAVLARAALSVLAAATGGQHGQQ